MSSPQVGIQSRFAGLAAALMLVALWLLMHGYHGLTGDGQIYAFQAFARIHPQLATDLYLQNTSQDRFTLFSPLYAWWIELLGLENAARILTLLFTIWFLTAAWGFARAVAGRDAAWAAVAFLLIAEGSYGGSGVFRLLDPFLTARLPAEALIVTALACQARGMRWLGVSLALGAMLIHPLMGLPGLLIVLCLWLPNRAGVLGAVVGVLATLAIAEAAVDLSYVSHVLTVMDAPWLDVVRERSQFLFLQLWSMRDWETNVQPFLYLGFTAIAVPEERIRKLCAAAALVGAAGLVVALIGGLVGPVALLVQGQAWRWVWIAVLVSEVLLPYTAMRVGREEKCGPLCALLLVCGWTLPGIDGAVCIGLAWMLWLARPHIHSLAAAYFRYAFAALAAAIGVWILIKWRAIVSSPNPPSDLAPLRVTQIQQFFALKITAVLLAALVWWALRIARKTRVFIVLSAILAGFSALIFPTAFSQPRTIAPPVDTQEFADWEKVIPPTSTVLVTPPRDLGAFVWFTLNRPNYLTLDQSAGVVFSRATALEIRRRSEVLLPLMDEDWKILTRLRDRAGGGRKKPAIARSLTRKNLTHICADPQLGFVISPQKIGFDPIRHEHPGIWKDWNLYDCREVRSAPVI